MSSNIIRPEMKNPLDELKSANNIIRKLKLVIEINTYITKSLESEKVQKSILFQVKRLLNCETSSILLVNKEHNRLEFAFFSREDEGDRLIDVNLKMGEGIAGTVWSNGTPIMINDAQNDPRFTDKVDKKTNNMTNSIIAVPLTVNGEIIGVLEAINKKSGDFTAFDLEMLHYISTQSAIAFKNAELYDMANKDGMTRLFSNKYFKERLHEEWLRSSRYKHPLSIVMLDIDNFKLFNNTYGHQAGDIVIKETANVITANLRKIDIPCRYGGEEFSVIFPETSREEVTIVVERIRNKIETMRIEFNDSYLHVTASGGLASIPELAPSGYNEMIEMADKALYISKNSGKNRISFYKS